MERVGEKCPFSGKERFKTYLAAMRSQKMILRRHGPYLSIYRCRYCKGYHLTHRKKRKKVSRRQYD